MLNILQKIFKQNNVPVKTERAEIMSGSPTVFTPFSGNAYASDIYRAAVDAIARNAAKLKPSHIVINDQRRTVGDEKLNRILQFRPNPYMSTYDLIYKLVTHYFLFNNSFAYLQKDERGILQAIWPLSPQYMEFVSDQSNQLYCIFVFAGGKSVTLPFSEVFLIRRFYNSNDLLGDPNSAILPTLDLAHAQSQGLTNAIKSSATIRGLLKYNQILAPEKLKEEKDAFIKDYLSVSNNGGIAALDNKAEYIPLEPNTTTIDEKQLLAVKVKINDYLGISEKIVNSSYSEDES